MNLFISVLKYCIKYILKFNRSSLACLFCGNNCIKVQCPVKRSTSQKVPRSKGLQVKRSPVKRSTSQKVPSQKVYKSKGLQVKRSPGQKVYKSKGPQVKRATSQKVPSQKVYKNLKENKGIMLRKEIYYLQFHNNM